MSSPSYLLRGNGVYKRSIRIAGFRFYDVCPCRGPQSHTACIVHFCALRFREAVVDDLYCTLNTVVYLSYALRADASSMLHISLIVYSQRHRARIVMDLAFLTSSLSKASSSSFSASSLSLRRRTRLSLLLRASATCASISASRFAIYSGSKRERESSALDNMLQHLSGSISLLGRNENDP